MRPGKCLWISEASVLGCSNGCMPVLGQAPDALLYGGHGDLPLVRQREHFDGSAGRSAGTWSNGFAAVYHLEDCGNNATIHDSLGAHDATGGSTNASIAGQIGNAADIYNGQAAGAITTPSLGTFTKASFITVSAWAKTTISQGEVKSVVAQIGNWYEFMAYLAFAAWGQVTAYANRTNSAWDQATGSQVTVGDWDYLVGLWDGSYVRIFRNNEDPVAVEYSAVRTASANNRGWTIGKYSQDGTDYYPADRYIDEVRIANVLRSAGWIETEYNNQVDPSSFYEVGDESGGAGGLLLNPDLRGGFRTMRGGF